MLRRTDHVSDGDLIRLADGEASALQSRRVRRHLAHCPHCEARQQTMDAVLQEISAEHSKEARPRDSRQQFRARLHRLARSSPQLDLIDRLRNWFAAGMRTPFAARALTCACVILLAALWLLPHREKVSADDVLTRANEAQVTRARTAREPVALQKLKLRDVSRRGSSGEQIEVWRDSKTGAVRQVGGGALWKEFQQLQNEYRGREDKILSAEDFATWRSSVRDRQDEVVRERPAGGPEVLVVRTSVRRPSSGTHLVGGNLVVRASDWMPLSRSFRLDTGDAVHECQVSEVEFVAMKRGDIPRGIFPEPARPPGLTESAGMLPGRSGAASPDSAGAAQLSEEELQEFEAKVHYAVHRSRLCLTGTLNVRRQGGRVLVSGTVDTRSELESLLTLLPTSDALTVSVQPDDGPGAAAPPPDRSPEPAGSAPPAGPSTVQDPGLSNKVVALSRSALLESWAIGRLTDAYPSLPCAALPVPVKRLVLTMLRDHVNAMRGDLTAGGRLLSGSRRNDSAAVAGNAIPVTLAPFTTPLTCPLDGDGSRLVRSMEIIDVAVRGAFAGDAGGREGELAGSLERSFQSLGDWLLQWEHLKLRDVQTSGQVRP